MRAVNICIGHHNNLVITRLRNIKTCARSCSNNLNDCSALFVREHLSKTCFLNVQNLTAYWQKRLESRVSCSFCSTKRRIALNDEKFCNIVVSRLAIRKLRRHRSRLKRILSASNFLSFTRLNTRMHLGNNFL